MLRATLIALALVGAGCAGAPTATVGAPSTTAARTPQAVTLTPDATTGHRKPLRGRVVGIDPGHNGRNYTDPAYLSRQIWNGREREDCDTTGTETASGYTEPRFTFRVARFLTRDLRRLGATVVLTRHGNDGVGPCVDRRAEIINRARADVALDIHADGGPPTGRGFAILEPVRDHRNRHVIAPSARFGRMVRHALLTMTSMPPSTYDGRRGITHRDDLAGLNLATEPKVLVECGNMRNVVDARKLTSTTFQRHVAKAFSHAVAHFLRHRH